MWPCRPRDLGILPLERIESSATYKDNETASVSDCIGYAKVTSVLTETITFL